MDMNIQFLPALGWSLEAQITRLKPSILVVFFPGGFTSPDRYEGFLQALSHSSGSAEDLQHHAEQAEDDTVRSKARERPVHLHIGTGSFTNNIAKISEAKQMLHDIVELAIHTLSEDFVPGKERCPCPIDHVYIVGHSLGGLMLFEEILLDLQLPANLEIHGAISLSATINSLGKLPSVSRSLASYPIPLLTVLGERDGRIRAFNLADELDHLDDYIQSTSSQTESAAFSRWRRDDCETSKANIEQGNRTTEDTYKLHVLLQKPVVFAKEINHMQCADGITSTAQLRTGRDDLHSKLTLQEAWKYLASIAFDFIAYHSTKAPRYKSFLIDWIQSSRHELESFRLLSKLSSVREFVQSLQHDVLKTSLQNWECSPFESIQTFLQFHNQQSDFLHSNSTIDCNDSIHDQDCRYQINAHAILMHDERLLAFSKGMPKQRSPSLVVQFVSSISFNSVNPMNSCANDKKESDANDSKHLEDVCQWSLQSWNQHTFDTVLNQYVTMEQRERYLHCGRQLEFLPDNRMLSSILLNPTTPISSSKATNPAEGFERDMGDNADTNMIDLVSKFLETPSELTHDKTKAFLKSPLLILPHSNGFKTNYCAMVNPFGRVYAKPISPAQAYEWITFDSFKKEPTCESSPSS